MGEAPTIEEAGDARVVTLSGEIDAYTAPSLRLDLRHLVETGAPVVVEDDGPGFDGDAVEEWDAEGLGEDGMGLAIIKAVAEDVEVGPRDGATGTRLRFTRSLR